jgi:hypothetical protein
MQIFAAKFLKTISLYCKMSDPVICWNHLSEIISALFPCKKYMQAPTVKMKFTDKTSLARCFKEYNDGRKMSDYACEMVSQELDRMINHIVEILEEVRRPDGGKLTNEMVRTIIFGDPLFTDLLPFLCDPFV